MQSLLSGAAAVLLSLPLPLAAQAATDAVLIVPAQPAEALIVAPVQAPAGPILQTGTEVSLRLLEQLTTRNGSLRVGRRFRLETAEPVVVDGVTVIPLGSRATGEITEVRNKGMWGRSGRFVARLLYVTVNGRRIRLNGEFDDKGKAGGVGAVAVSALVFLPAGFFMTGTSAMLPPGTQITGFIDEDVPLVMQGGQEPAQQSAPSNLAIASTAAPPPVEDIQTRPVAGNSRVRCQTCR